MIRVHWTAAIAGALLAGATAPALAQYYYPAPPRYQGQPPGYDYGPRGYEYGPRGYYAQRRGGGMSRVCATDMGTACYGDWQYIGSWCKCGRRETRATGTIVPEE